MSIYPEIQALQGLYNRHTIQVQVMEGVFLGNKQHYPKVLFRLNDHSFELYIDDEYGDMAIGNPLLSLCLILRELEVYQEEEDILRWCKSKGLNSNDIEVLAYYKALSKIYFQVAQLIGIVDSFITDLDFQQNAGAVQLLRIEKYNNK